jgi:hypothetical protein
VEINLTIIEIGPTMVPSIVFNFLSPEFGCSYMVIEVID